jgi:integrase
MASIFKRSDSQFWVGCFTAQDGRQLKRSTKTTDRKLALQLANQFEASYKKVRTEQQVRRILFDIHEDLTGQKLQIAVTKDFLNQWAERGKATLAPRTHAKYEGVIRQFIESLGDKATLDLSLITPADVAKFRDGLASRLSVGTANIALKIVRAAFAEAVRQTVVVSNPAVLVKVLSKRHTDAEQRRPFTISELQKILSVADDEWKGIILLGLYTGQRLGDISRLTWQNVDLEKNELRLITRKTGRRQMIPLATALVEYFENLDATDDPKQPLFPGAMAKLSTAKNGESGALSNAFRDILESAGMVETRAKDHRKEGQGRSARRQVSELSFHCLRHTATSLLKNAGVSDVVARELIGHDSVEVSRSYTHVEDATLKRAIAGMVDVTKPTPSPNAKKGKKK